MKNKKVADILYEIANILEIQEVKYKPRTYRKAARNIESLSEDIADIYKRGKLREISGIGKSIAKKIAEYLETGKLEYYENLKEDLPVDIEALTKVKGIGPKTAKKLYQELGVTGLEDLEQTAEKGEIVHLKGFGERSQEKILKHIEAAKKGKERTLIGRAFPIVHELENRLKRFDVFDNVITVGSFRRCQPTVGDLDILATSSDPEQAMEKFCNFKDIEEVLAKGRTKSSIIIPGGLEVDLRIVDEDSYGSALLYFTGSKDHNVALRNRVKKRDWKLNEYGLFDSENNKIAGKTEEAVYKKLGLSFIPPELRENTGEIEASEKDEIPDLVKLEDIRGDLQIHTKHSDGSDSIQEMAHKAEEIGLEYILISEHGPSLQVAGGINEEEFEKQRTEIDEINENTNVKVLHGIEANITDNGLDISQEWCEDCDFVVVAIHDRPKNPTERILKVFEEYPVDIFAHPLNRLINKREPLDLNLPKIMDNAAEKKIAIEINSQPERLDLDWQNVKKYRNKVEFVISTDAHSMMEMEFMHLGITQARRGWCEAKNILNTKSLNDMRSYFDG